MRGRCAVNGSWWWWRQFTPSLLMVSSEFPKPAHTRKFPVLFITYSAAQFLGQKALSVWGPSGCLVSPKRRPELLGRGAGTVDI